MSASEKERKISGMWDCIINASHSKVNKYVVIEYSDGFLVSSLEVEEKERATVMIFANDKRRNGKSLIEVSLNGKVVAWQDGNADLWNWAERASD